MRAIALVIAFLRRPLNKAGIVTVLGTLWAVLQGTLPWPASLPIFAGAIVALLIPDNSVVKGDVAKAVADSVQDWSKVWDDIAYQQRAQSSQIAKLAATLKKPETP